MKQYILLLDSGDKLSSFIGVDGCKTGWFYFRQDGSRISHGVSIDFASLINSLPANSKVFIDIPIGLIENGATGRACDSQARELLGKRAPSVFSAPCRPVLSATSYEEAKRLSMAAIGKKLSKQTFAITPKIKQVDDYLTANSDRDAVVREVHPEVCFWGLNDQIPMQHKKKSKLGFEERLAVLCKSLPGANDLVNEVLTTYLRKEVARDDILDAMVALIVSCADESDLKTIPDMPEVDVRGLRMEMVYRLGD